MHGMDGHWISNELNFLRINLYFVAIFKFSFEYIINRIPTFKYIKKKT